MEFDDLLTEIDLECPHCNRKFQQQAREGRAGEEVECPGCGEPVAVKEEGK